ncbi:TolC family protein [Prosthecochloris sp. GSB1]|uniref:TolC family protein n=1 Tax=Prosthecochloris sp. GSB1 TaxID=281093 RepID=UPI001F399291|nr:TolC family protein [Prosthecochloris sp. GSB1]
MIMKKTPGRTFVGPLAVFLVSLTALSVVCALPENVYGQERLSLREAVFEALERNPDILVARGEERISRNNVNIGNAGLLPRIDLVGSVNYQDNEEPAQTGLTEYTSTSAAIKASYTLFDGFGNIYTFRKLKSAGRKGMLQARNTIENVILSVGEAYYGLADAVEQVAVAEEAIAISGDRLKRARLRSEYGQANALEVLSATVDANADSVSWKDAVLGMENARRTLNLLLDRPIGSNYQIEKEVRYDATLKKDDVLAEAKTSYSSYLITLEAVKQAEYGVGIARSDFFPQLGVEASYGYSETLEGFDAGMNDPSGSFSAGLTLTYNLFNGFQSSINSQNARIELQNSRLLERKAAAELEKQVADTWQAYRNSLDILEFQKKNLETAELNFRRSKELYVLGQLTTTAFREAQLNLIDARKSIASAGYDAKILEQRLLRLAGRLVGEGDKAEVGSEN